MTDQLLIWIGFGVFVLAMLALELGVFHRRTHTVGMKEALTWSAVWVALALLFNAGVWHWRGHDKGLEFLTGYLVELSLSVDNLVVFLLLFAYLHYGLAAVLVFVGGKMLLAGFYKTLRSLRCWSSSGCWREQWWRRCSTPGGSARRPHCQA